MRTDLLRHVPTLTVRKIAFLVLLAIVAVIIYRNCMIYFGVFGYKTVPSDIWIYESLAIWLPIAVAICAPFDALATMRDVFLAIYAAPSFHLLGSVYSMVVRGSAAVAVPPGATPIPLEAILLPVAFVGLFCLGLDRKRYGETIGFMAASAAISTFFYAQFFWLSGASG
jgi:hypothetical protein